MLVPSHEHISSLFEKKGVLWALLVVVGFSDLPSKSPLAYPLL